MSPEPSDGKHSTHSHMMKFVCAGMFPALQRTLTLTSLKPGAVNRVIGVTESVGGKATNAARVLKTLGGNPLLFGFAGGDNAVTVKRLLAAEGIAYRFVSTAAPVRLAQTLLAKDAADFTELVEEGPVLTPEDWQRFQSMFVEILTDKPVAAIISGTLPAHAPGNAYAQMLATTSTLPVILDASGAALRATLPHKPALVKINLAELFLTVGVDAGTSAGDAKIEAAAHTLIADGAAAVGITQGGHAAWLVTKHKTRCFTIPAVKVISTLGCGDAVNAGVAFGLQQYQNLEEAFILGLACGVSNAMHRLPGMIDPTQISSIAARIRS